MVRLTSDRSTCWFWYIYNVIKNFIMKEISMYHKFTEKLQMSWSITTYYKEAVNEMIYVITRLSKHFISVLRKWLCLYFKTACMYNKCWTKICHIPVFVHKEHQSNIKWLFLWFNQWQAKFKCLNYVRTWL